jgi:hypothetical protein
MFCKYFLVAVMSFMALAFAGAASADVTFTASYSVAHRVGPAHESIVFTIVNTGPARENLNFVYNVTGPTNFAGGGVSSPCGLASTIEAGRVYVGVLPGPLGVTLPANATCTITVDFDATLGTHTRSNATLMYDGGSVALSDGANPTMVVASTAAVPTLSEWGLILMGLVLAGSATLVMQRRLRPI